MFDGTNLTLISDMDQDKFFCEQLKFHAQLCIDPD